MAPTVRIARPGDGAGIARVWLDASAYYAELDPGHFKVPDAPGLETCQAFSVVRIGPWPGAMTMRLAVSVRLAQEVVHRSGSRVGSRAAAQARL